jgi:hypothetical protein
MISRLAKIVLLLIPTLLGGMLPFVPAQEPAKVKHARGHVATKHLAALKAEDAVRHSALVKSWKTATQSSFDLRTTNVIGPIKDQQQCGSCWDFSGTCLVESCQFQAGVLKNDGTGALSEQYTLDCGQNGGCNGDDNTTVLAWGKATGIPTTAAYGPYQAQAGRCKYTSAMTLYKIPDWGFCDGGQGNGVTSTQLIKNALVATGLPIGVAVAAGDPWDNYTTGVYVGSGATSIDHDVVIVGWQDYDATHVAPSGSKATGYWFMRNSWNTSWGVQGYMWIEYGADCIGTEAVYVTPSSPTPVPVMGAPAVTSVLTATGVVGTPFSYQITASNTPTAFAASNLPAGLSVSTAGLISGTPQTAAVTAITVSAANTSGAGIATLTLTVTGVAPPVPVPVPPAPGPMTPVNITLTTDQIQAVVNSAGGVVLPTNAVVMTSDMTFKEYESAMQALKDGVGYIPPRLKAGCCPPLKPVAPQTKEPQKLPTLPKALTPKVPNGNLSSKPFISLLNYLDMR